MEETFYQLLFWIAIIVSIGFVYKWDNRLGKILLFPFGMALSCLLVIFIYSVIYFTIDSAGFMLKHPKVYEFAFHNNMIKLFLEFTGILSVFYSSYILFVEIKIDKTSSYIKFWIFLLLGLIIIFNF